jgi:hypothetical protein
MHPTRPPRLFLLPVAAVSALLGCATPHAPVAAPVARRAPAPVHHISESNVPVTWSTKATLKLMSPWARCHERFATNGGDARSEVARLSAACAEATHMHRLGEPFTGEQKASGAPQTYGFKARAGHCYRAYGAGAAGIKNLDLLMQDSEGSVLGQDGTDDGAPVVLDAGAACFKKDDDAAIVVSVGDGAGAYAVEVWED